MSDCATLNTSDVVYREDLYPRFKPNPAKIQEYSENIERLPPIELNQDNILIDGYHRLTAFETAKIEQIPYILTETKTESELEILAVQRNATHGQQLTQEEKRSYALKWWGVISDDDIVSALSISKKTLERYTKTKRDEQEAQIKQQIYDLWLSCETHENISAMVKKPRQTVTDIIAKIAENGQLSDTGIFRDFNDEDSPRRIYDIWNFGKATNEVKHFGNIPPEIIENLLYYYTNPYDVVFDPFGGGGSTIDICIKRKRRYFVSDLNPIPARNDIRKHDITTGLPDGLPVPKFVFLDPPYWKQAAGKYSDDVSDLSNVDLETFLTTIGNIARDVKRKWNGDKQGYLSLIIGPYKENGKIIDLSYLCYDRISKYLNPVRRVIVPYSTQIHGGAYVAKAKEDKEILYLYRDLVVFSNEF
jgi:hypothetical protein